MSNSRYFRRFGACAVVLTALGLASCKSDPKTSEPTIAQTIVVVSANDTQSKLLTEIYAQALEKGGFRVGRRDPVADLPAAYAALKAGAADLFVTHTGELLAYTGANEPAAASTSTTEVATTTTGAPTTTTTGSTTADSTGDSTGDTTGVTTGDSADIPTGSADIPVDASSTTIVGEVTTTTVSIVGQASAASINLQTNLIGEILSESLKIGAASDAEDKSVIACNGAVATTGSLSTLSDVAMAAEVLSVAGPAAFETDTPFGLPGFEKTYGASFKKFIAEDPAKVGEAITTPTTTPDTSVSTTVAAAADTSGATTTTVPALPSDADCGAFNSLDTTMPADAVVMDDDKNWIETNGVIPLLTTAAYTSGVSQLIDQVSQTLTTSDLRGMLAQIASGSDSPQSMASKYITATGLGGA